MLAKLKEPVRFSPQLNASLADLMASARWGAGLIAAKVNCRTLGAYSKPDSPDGVTQFRAVEKVVTSESAVTRAQKAYRDEHPRCRLLNPRTSAHGTGARLGKGCR